MEASPEEKARQYNGHAIAEEFKIISVAYDSIEDPFCRAQCAGWHFETKIQTISQYVQIHRKNLFDVRVQELVSKVQNPGRFLRKQIPFLDRESRKI